MKESWRCPRLPEMVRQYPYSTAYVALTGYALALVQVLFG